MIEQESSKVMEFYRIGILAGWLAGLFLSVKWGMDENDQQFVGGGGAGRGGTGRGGGQTCMAMEKKTCHHQASWQQMGPTL